MQKSVLQNYVASEKTADRVLKQDCALCSTKVQTLPSLKTRRQSWGAVATKTSLSCRKATRKPHPTSARPSRQDNQYTSNPTRTERSLLTVSSTLWKTRTSARPQEPRCTTMLPATVSRNIPLSAQTSRNIPTTKETPHTTFSLSAAITALSPAAHSRTRKRQRTNWHASTARQN